MQWKFIDICENINHSIIFLYKLKNKDKSILKLKSKIDDIKAEKPDSEEKMSKIIENLEIYYNIVNNRMNRYKEPQCAGSGLTDGQKLSIRINILMFYSVYNKNLKFPKKFIFSSYLLIRFCPSISWICYYLNIINTKSNIFT